MGTFFTPGGHGIKWHGDSQPSMGRHHYVMSLPDTFSKWVDSSSDSGCLLWTGKKDVFKFQEKGTRTARTPWRASWEFVNGPLPADQVVTRTCGSEKCVAPGHLVTVACKPRPSRPTKAPAVFWAQSAPQPSGCITWTGTINQDGYGSCTWDGATWKAHRLAYTLVVGPIPPGLELDHTCRNRSCVSPLHLDPVTPSTNATRAIPFRTQARPFIPTLSQAVVDAVRNDGSTVVSDLARKYGVSRRTVARVLRGER